MQEETATYVGPLLQAANGRGTGVLRQGSLSELVIANGRAFYAELASRGQVFSVFTANTGATIAAGHVAPPAAAAATTLTLSNPVGSGYNFEIIAGILTHLTGTPATGSWSWCAAPAVGATVITATPNATPKSGLLSGAASVGLGYTATALTSGPLHVVQRQFANSMFAGAIAATSTNTNVIDQVDGALVVPPGYVITLAPPGAGTTHVVMAQIVYAQIPIS